MGVACVALVLSLGGTGYAAATIGSGQIRNRSIQSIDLANQSVSQTKLKTGSVTGRSINDGAVSVDDLADNAKPGGLQAPTRVASAEVTLGPGQINGTQVSCPADTVVVGGGYRTIGADNEVFVADTYGGSSTWYVSVDNFDSSVTATVNATAYCAATGPTATAVSRKADIEAARRAAADIAARRASRAG